MNRIKVTLQHHTPLYISADGARTCWASQDKSDTIEDRLCPSCNSCDFTFLPQPLDYYKCDNCNAEFSNPTTLKEIGPKDLALIDRVGNQFHHASILEHISFNFFIDGISRACLQEISRHRIASLSVKSSRYTLKELKDLTYPLIEELNDEQKYHAESAGADITYCSVLEKTYLIDYYNLYKYLVMTDDTSVNICTALALENLRKLIRANKTNDKAKYALPESYRTQLTWTINMRSLQNFLFLRSDKKALPEIQLLAHLIYKALPADAQSLVAHCVKGGEDATV